MADDDERDIYSPEFKDLFEHMTAFNPKDRYSMEDIMAHPWFKG
jgi:serine/threonine protein kinase